MTALMTCRSCGTQAPAVGPEARVTRSGERIDHGCPLPVGWDHHDPQKAWRSTGRPHACGEVVCGPCIDALLDRLLEQFRRAAQAGRL